MDKLRVLAELSEEVADNEGSKAVEEENFTHQPEVVIGHDHITVVFLALEVSNLSPKQNDSVEDYVSNHQIVIAQSLLKAAKRETTEDKVGDVKSKKSPAYYLHRLTLRERNQLLFLFTEDHDATHAHAHRREDVENIHASPEASIFDREFDVLLGHSITV